MEQNNLALYEARLTDLWERMVRTIGIHTVNVLVERAIWEASQKHPELALIEHDDTGFSFDALNKSCADRTEREVAEDFSDLTTELLLILARLLGKEMAQRLAEELEVRMAGERRTPLEGEAAP